MKSDHGVDLSKPQAGWQIWVRSALQGLLAIALIVQVFQRPMDNADGAGMIAHLWTLFGDGDLLYDDEYALLGMSPIFAFVTREGLVSNHWPIGASFLQLPAYLVARLAGGLVGIESEGGVRAVALLQTTLSAWGGTCLLLWLHDALRCVRAYLGQGDALLLLTAFSLGTPLVFYATQAPERPHFWGFLLFWMAMRVAWDLIRSDEASSGSHPYDLREFASVALLGMATAVRPQLAPFLLILLGAFSIRIRGASWRRRVGRCAVLCLAFVPGLLVNVLLQTWMYGGEMSNYGVEVSHHPLQLLFSAYHGVGIWSPLILFACVSAPWSFYTLRHGKAWQSESTLWQGLGGVAFGLLILQFWLNSGEREITPFSVLGTRTWGGGLAFGPRKLLDSAVMYLPMLVAFMWQARHRPRLRWILRALWCIVSLWGGLLMAIAIVSPPFLSEVWTWSSFFTEVQHYLTHANAWEPLQNRVLPARYLLTSALSVLIFGIPAYAWRRWMWQNGPGLGSKGRQLALLFAVIVPWAVVVYVNVLIARTDMLISDNPTRIIQVAERLQSPHQRLVAQIPFAKEKRRRTLDHDFGGKN